MWERYDNGLLKFRCHVGHSFTGETLLGQQAEALEQALWTALRTLEESAALGKRMAAHARERRMFAIAERYDRQAAAFEDRAGIGQKGARDRSIDRWRKCDGRTGRRARPPGGQGLTDHVKEED